VGRLALVLAIACVTCAPPRFARVAKVATTTIERVELQWSNVYLLRAGAAIALVDAGSPVDRDRLFDALARAGVHPRDVRVVIITHGHADHAGLARWLQLYGASVVLGAGDVGMAKNGANLPLSPTSLFAAALAPMFEFPYDPFTPDVAVAPDAPIDLARFGFADVRVIALPGHTAGSIVVRVGDGDALVGDMVLGGWFGGKLWPQRAGEHYYQADRRANYGNVGQLLAMGIQRFYPGHGGPIGRESMKSWLDGVKK
jgi:glyoxylase-like metal-dependent hydrolase (beta-lactamase superfamily II)